MPLLPLESHRARPSHPRSRRRPPGGRYPRRPPRVDCTYSVLRITAELRDAGHVVNHKRVARVMRGIGLAGLRLRSRHRTTTADPATV
ncbi:IS3 family transposase [Umezawaea sp.]|uniref:IS3 family transposase n=1 Tax=Umezawaea sp. TaxID=1955258 RepID=UPI0039C9976F